MDDTECPIKAGKALRFEILQKPQSIMRPYRWSRATFIDLQMHRHSPLTSIRYLIFRSRTSSRTKKSIKARSKSVDNCFQRIQDFRKGGHRTQPDRHSIMTRLLSSTLLLLLPILTSAQNATITASQTLCPSPTGFQNTVVPAPTATGTFQVNPAFWSVHTLFIVTLATQTLSEAQVATFCLDQCIAVQPNATNPNPCLSFNVNFGKPIPALPPSEGGDAARWYCSGYDAPLSTSSYVPVDAPGSYQHELAVNRVCCGVFRAY